MNFSLVESSAEVASSSARIGLLAMIDRARAILWRSPPESFTPRSPTKVSYPSGRAMIKSCAKACLAA